MDKKAEVKAALKEYWANNKKQIIRTGAIVFGAICGLAIITIVAASVAEEKIADQEDPNLLEGQILDTPPFEAEGTVETTN